MGALLELKHISKRYSSLYANRDISLKVDPGEVLCLLGENGAGKSTLMNVLYGMTHPDEGEIFIGGKKIHLATSRDAIAAGIGMVHQHFMLIPAMTVLENLILAAGKTGRLLVDKDGMRKKVREISDRYHLTIEPDMKVEDLSVGQQQKVEIIKALYHKCSILILDEPTAVLTPDETEDLYQIIEQFRRENKAVIFITHKLHEVMHIADRVCVLRDGELVLTALRSETTEDDLTCAMVGRPMKLTVGEKKERFGREVLSIHDLSVRGKKENLAVNGLSLTVHAGEIYGIAGVDGNGQSELVGAITGLARANSGTVTILGRDVTSMTSGEILKCGVAHIPEDRQHVGILLNESLFENLILHDFEKEKYHKGLFLDWKALRAAAGRMKEEYNVKAPGMDEPISSLSGGNQQKAVVARELEQQPELLLAIHPTRGVDIGATEFIHQRILEARDRGCAVLLISSELDEILRLADTIGVIFEGRIIGEQSGKNATSVSVGKYMAGGVRKAEEGTTQTGLRADAAKSLAGA